LRELMIKKLIKFENAHNSKRANVSFSFHEYGGFLKTFGFIVFS